MTPEELFQRLLDSRGHSAAAPGQQANFQPEFGPWKHYGNRYSLLWNSPGRPHNVLSAFTRVADIDLDTFRGTSTIVSPTLADAYRPVLSSKPQVSAVFPDDVLFELHTDPEFINYMKEHGFGSYLRQGIAARDSELLFGPESLPCISPFVKTPG